MKHETKAAPKAAEKKEPKKPSPADRDAAYQKRREDAYRLGHAARCREEARDSNPYTRVRWVAAYTEYEAGRRDLKLKPEPFSSWVERRYTETEIERNAWWEGWDATDRLALERGIDTAAQRAMFSKKERKVPPHKVKGQTDLLGAEVAS